MSKLIFRIGEEGSPVVPPRREEYENSPFRESLEDAREVVVRIVNSYTDTLKDGGTHDSFQQNNIVAFLGDRGSGKTSCMHAMIKGLSDNFGWKLPDKELAFLPVIDPSFFDSKHNILELFIGELFREYKKMREKWLQLNDVKKENLRELQRKFTDVKRALRFVKKNDDNLELEEQEELLGLSEGVNLVALMGNLIEDYLKCVEKDILIISIDDIDVHINEVFVMMEQVRKYLNQPNVVVLMAAKLQQLNQAICLYYYKEVLPKVGDEYKDLVVPDVMDIAERYLDKFIPSSHRIFMPSIEVVASSDLEIIGEDGSTMSSGTVEFTILSLIYEKCGYLFYNYEDAPSLIIPRNLREVRNLTSVLYHMEYRGINSKIHNKNKLIFKNFFYNQWLADLPDTVQSFARGLISERNLLQLNKLTIDRLSNFFRFNSKSQDSEKKNADELSDFEKIVEVRLAEICNPDNIASNISIGDVLFLIDQIGQRVNRPDVRKLLFFITTHYSMLLYEAYDLLSDNEAYLLGKTVYDPDQPAVPKLHHNRNADIPDYFKLVGNSFFIHTGGKFLPKDFSGISRELTMIDGWRLGDEIKKMREEISNNPEYAKKNIWPAKWLVLEFFILTSTRRYETKKASFSIDRTDNWRADSTVNPYFPSFQGRPKNILFDITSPFINMLSPKMAYDRYADGLYAAVLKCKGSLLYQFYSSRRDRDISREHDLLSQIAIRNIEVLNDLQWWMEKRSRNLRPSASDIIAGTINVFRSFYEGFDGKTHYSVVTYHKRDCPDQGSTDTTSKGSSFHTITFKPLALLGKCLERIENDNDALKLFTSIYSPVYMFTIDRVYTAEEIRYVLERSEELRFWGNTKDVITLFSKPPLKDKEQITNQELLSILADFQVDEITLSSCLDPQLLKEYHKICINRVKVDIDDIDKQRGKLIGKLEPVKGKIKIYEDEIKRISSDISAMKKEREKIRKDRTGILKKISDLKISEEGRNLWIQEDYKLSLSESKTEESINALEKDLRASNTMKADLQFQLAELNGVLAELNSRRDVLMMTLRSEDRYRYRR